MGLQRAPWHWIVWPAIVMSLGWALRGYIGGGPLGAMIPGALVALVVCLLLRRDGDEAAIIAAFGAIGIGFGGQMTYGQTIGLALQEETRLWGLLGLAVKGAIWGFLGNAMLGVALLRPSLSNKRIIIACLGLVAFTFLGWKQINELKLIYFSNRFDRPRQESWAGLLCGALFLLFWLKQRVLWGFAWRGALCGAIGFGLGGYIQVVGKQLGPNPLIGYWKQMELFFGAMLGVSVGWATWRWRAELGGLSAVGRRPAIWLQVVLGALLITAALVAMELPIHVAFTVFGILLLLLTLHVPWAGWQVAITMTFAAFTLDYRENRPAMDQTLLLLMAVTTSLVVGWLAARWPHPRVLFVLLLSLAVLNSLAKSFLPWPEKQHENLVAMESLFVLMMLASLAIAEWLRRREAALN